MSRYAKFFIALLGAVGAWGATAWINDNQFTVDEYFGLMLALATAFGVYQVPNTPPPGEPSDPNISETDPVV